MEIIDADPDGNGGSELVVGLVADANGTPYGLVVGALGVMCGFECCVAFGGECGVALERGAVLALECAEFVGHSFDSFLIWSVAMWVVVRDLPMARVLVVDSMALSRSWSMSERRRSGWVVVLNGVRDAEVRRAGSREAGKWMSFIAHPLSSPQAFLVSLPRRTSVAIWPLSW